MRVTHLIPTLESGGAEVTLKRLVKSTDPSEVQHSIVAFWRGGSLDAEMSQHGVRIVGLGSPETPAIIKVLRSLRAIRDLRPDVIHAWMYHANLIGGIVGRLLRVPVLWSFRMSADPRGMDEQTWRVARLLCGPLQWLPTRTMACSQEAAQSHRQIGFQRPIDVIENGFLSRSIDDHEQGDARRVYGIDPGAFVIGRPGRWDPAKDHETLIDAFAWAAREDDNLFLMMAGRDIDQSNSVLLSTLHDAGIEDRVFLLGEEHDMDRFYAACDLLCSSSITEGFPNVVAEAMALGVPVVATDVGGTAGIVGDTGWLVPPSDPLRLAETLLEAVGVGPSRLRALGFEARSRIDDEFGIDRMVHRYESLYGHLVEQ